jgi:putative membrane protein
VIRAASESVITEKNSARRCEVMHGFGMGFNFFGVVLILLFWVGLILLSVWLIKSLFQGGSPPGISNYEKRDTPTEILDRRFARGEITREQYEFMKKDIT